MRIVLLLAFGIAACSAERAPEVFNAEAKAQAQAAKERAADNRAVRAGFAPDQPQPMKTVSVDPPKTPAPGAILPPGDRQYRYIGRWAATPDLCERGSWRFETRKLSIAENTRCDLPEVSATPAGYTLVGTCRAAGARTEQTLTLTFDEQRRTMRVSGYPPRPADLIYCGD